MKQRILHIAISFFSLSATISIVADNEKKDIAICNYRDKIVGFECYFEGDGPIKINTSFIDSLFDDIDNIYSQCKKDDVEKPKIMSKPIQKPISKPISFNFN